MLRPTMLAGLFSLASGVIFAGDAEAVRSVLSRAPYLQCATPTSICVVWRTDQRIDPVVRFGSSLEPLQQQVTGARITTRVALSANKAEVQTLTNRWPDLGSLPKLHSAPVGTFQYEAHLTGLTPNSQYYYQVCDGDRPLTERSPSYHFRTYPVPGTAKSIRFGTFGDSGTGREKQRQVWQALMAFTTRDNRPLDFFLHLGDMAYNRGRDIEFSTRFFAPYEATLRNTVFWPSFANHEAYTSKGLTGVGPYFDAYVCPTNAEAGGVPSAHEGFYSFDYGRTHIIALNSHDEDRRPTGRMAQWLKRDLAQARADWIITFFHHAPYSKGSHDSDREKQMIEMRTYMVPILEAGGVDLVLSGHSHIYERSMLMDGAYATPTVSENAILDDGDGQPKGDGPYRKPAGSMPNAGTVQVVAGHGGTNNRRKSTSPVMRTTILDHGSVVVDIHGDTLTAHMIDLHGDVRDTFSIVKRGTPTPMRLAYPWVPLPWVATKAQPASNEIGGYPPDSYAELIPRNAEWHFLAGDHPDGDAWMKVGFDARWWKTGETGVGYPSQNADVRTLLDDMKGRYTTVYLRREFEVEDAEQIADIGLLITYDDAFIAYLNGHEVVRKGVGRDRGKRAGDIQTRPTAERSKARYYPLKDFDKHLKTGRNVLAIEGHNAGLESSGFLVDPALIVED